MPDPDPPDPDPPDPELAAEQAHLDHAHRCLDAMRAHTARMIAIAEGGATETDSEAARYHLRKRAVSFDGRAPLSFGRLDTDAGETFHVGRRHVEDATGDPVVVDWRAPVSAPFYRATWRDPLGLTRRRRFSVVERTIVALHDEDLADPDAVGGGGVPDPLLAELERARTGEMRDIVATIQAEQDEIIRAPLHQLTVVQGGPGTGKTAVGLHRAAYLLYEHRRELEEQRVLVVGPNRVFLRYISDVLPSLGEHAVAQTTIEGLLAARFPVRAEDTAAVQRLKGDARMAEVVRRALDDLGSLPTEDTELRLPWGRVRLTATDVTSAMATARRRALDDTAAREVFRRVLARRVESRLLPQFRGEAPAGSDFAADARADAEFRRLVNRCWPTASGPALVRRLLGNRRALASAAHGILDADEQTLLHRSARRRLDDEQWTAADIPLLDEADAAVSGVRATYGHVVVDEAQDLSAMAWRMLARRCPTGSLTVLGDLAQSTAPAGHHDWTDIVAAIGAASRHESVELTVGYRVPAPILELAGRLLPLAAPAVAAPRSIRSAGEAPSVIAADSAEGLAPAVAGRARELSDLWSSVGIVAPGPLVDPVMAALRAAQVDAAPGDRGGLGHRVAVLDPAMAKGLEFDAVIAVEPATFLDQGAGGARLLYVAMTRCTHHLSVVHARPLPPMLTPSC